jgi:hypothetical protein
MHPASETNWPLPRGERGRLRTNPDQLDAMRAGDKWRSAFEEGVRRVAPIPASSRLVIEDTEIRGGFTPRRRHRDDDPGVGQSR